MSNDYGKSNYYKADSGKHYFNWQNENRIIGAKIDAKKFIPYINNEDTVLDFGCGGGHLLASIKCNKKYGIEINPYAREVANKYYPVFEDLSKIEKNSIDKVISNHCLEHVPYPIEALRQIKDCLIPGGKLILCIPIDDWRNEKYYNINDINNHLYTWTPQLIGNCLKEVGYQIDSIKINTFWYTQRIPLIHHLPDSIFYLICYFGSIIMKKREIMVVAIK